MTRVLVVGPAPAQAASRGGMATVIALMAAHPDACVITVPTYIEGPLWFRLWVGGSGMLRAAWLVARRRVDVLHVHLAHGGSVVRKALPMAVARWTKVPTVVHAHSYDFAGWFDGLAPPAQRVVRRLLVADQWLVLGTRHIAEYASRLRLPAERIAVLNNAVPIPAAPVEHADVQRVHAVSLGRLGVRKGSYDLVNAVAALDEDIRRRLRVTLAGDGEVDEVRAAVAAAGLGDTIHVAGWLDPAARDELLCAAHIFVLPSHDEGLPMALLEAMAHGLAPVTTLVGSIDEAITDRVTGLVVGPGRPEQIADALNELLKDDALRADLGAAARVRALDFGLDRWYQRLAQLWLDQARPEGGSPMKDVLLQSEAANLAARYVTVRNVGRVLGLSAMTAATEVLWRRRLTQDPAMAVADHFAPAGATVVDVGASWGLFSFHLARRVGRSGQLYSFEPHPDNAPMLRKLDRAHPHVHFSQAAVSDESGTAHLVVPEHHHRQVTAQGSLAHGFAGQGVDIRKIEVPLMQLDDVLGAAVDVDFVKIDVEGHEMSVLRGGANVLRRCRPALLIEIEQRHLSVPIGDVFRQIEDLGYHLFYVGESALRPIAEFDVERDQMSFLNSRANSGEFHPFAMPKGYVHDFCAVRSPELVSGFGG